MVRGHSPSAIRTSPSSLAPRSSRCRPWRCCGPASLSPASCSPSPPPVTVGSRRTSTVSGGSSTARACASTTCRTPPTSRSTCRPPRWRAEQRPLAARPELLRQARRDAGDLPCRGLGHRDYLDPGHPLQRAVRETVEDLTGIPVARIAVDGCGARCSPAPRPARPARADRDRAARHPGRTGGDGPARPPVVGRGNGSGRRPAHRRGARPDRQGRGGGRVRAALPDGRAVVLKVLDGAVRPVRAVAAAALRALGVDEPGLAEAGHTVLGHGVPVGRVEPVLTGPSAV